MELYEWQTALLKRMRMAGCGVAASKIEEELIDIGESDCRDPLKSAIVCRINDGGFMLFMKHIILKRSFFQIAKETNVSEAVLERKLDYALGQVFQV